MNHQPKALITGASSGIGAEFGRQLSQKGYVVTAVARNSQKLKNQVATWGEGHRCLVADLTVREELQKVKREMNEHHYDLLINNAGYGAHDYFESQDLDQLEKLMFLNMNALVHLTYQFIKSAGKGDAIINVSSVASEAPVPGGAVYSATKGFVTNFSEALWYENKERDIFIMALLPGMTKTNFQKVAMSNYKEQLSSGGYDPEVVVDEAIKELERRKTPKLISGPKYRYLLGVGQRVFDRKFMINTLAQYSPAVRERKRKVAKEWSMASFSPLFFLDVLRTFLKSI